MLQKLRKADLDFIILPLVSASFDRETADIAQIRSLSSQGLDSHPPEDRAFPWLAMLSVYPTHPHE
jgi:hypothetical protein